jgi:TatD DNase family protein
MFDTHCHLDNFISTSFSFSLNPNNNYLAVSTQSKDWLPLLEFSRNHNFVHPALGIHPWFVSENSLLELVSLKKLLSGDRVAALGEIGLDFGKKYRSNSQLQLDLFEQQLQLATAFNLPVSLHIVKAHNEALELLKKYPVKGVIHGFGTSVQMTLNYIELGLRLGVNGVCVRPNANRYHSLVKHFGISHLVLETDYPNVKLPGLVESTLDDIYQVAGKVAMLLNTSIEEVIRNTDNNANYLFRNYSRL